MIVRARISDRWILLFTSGLLFTSFSQTLTGKVVDDKNFGIKGAVVQLANAGLTTASADDGTWSVTVPTGIERTMRHWLLPSPILNGAMLYFAVTEHEMAVRATIYMLSGSIVHCVVNRSLVGSFYSLNLLERPLPAGMYAVQFQMGNKISNFKLFVAGKQQRSGGSLAITSGNIPLSEGLEKRKVIIDTVKVAKAGYAPASVPISTYTGDPLTITLTALVPAYHLNPPNPCYNQFVVKDCIQGDPTSACGGNCRVANSCNPPESADKANLPKTFICPRFMLYGTEMLAAAKDDAVQYGWGDGAEAPFNYGVVGHDADIGGVDDIQSSCCQCYQIIFETPEPSSPKPPDLPYPKSLIVQSFNTQASGPKGFDVFMGAGGYGAYNACYRDAAFSNTTKFNETMYDSFPYQNPSLGGISFLRYQTDCYKEWPPTVDGVMSAACQQKIKQLCDQALMKASVQITEDTRRSCIECNKTQSLYHQNWEVMVKRVRCPDNLTRVTGCRLKEDKLPLPLPDVQTPAQAKANGTFKTGYHTTTMQDCCKPTCAWSDWVTGPNYKLPADGEWNSFYSCDKNGKPFTK